MILCATQTRCFVLKISALQHATLVIVSFSIIGIPGTVVSVMNCVSGPGMILEYMKAGMGMLFTEVRTQP